MVMGANDGIVSTAALVLGMAAAGTSRGTIITAGVAGLVAGALSMAAGEYVSVASQRDAEEADLERERRELEAHPGEELDELAQIYEGRGLTPELARRVAVELSAHDPLASHARDEIGIDEARRARPFQAAVTSAAAFAIGAAIPVVAVGVGQSDGARIAITAAASMIALAGLGLLGARLGGARPVPATLRVLAWGAAAMALTFAIGALVGEVAL